MRIFLSSLILLLFITSSYGQKNLSLDEAINIALKRNTVLQRNINNIESAQSNVKASWGNFLPSLGAQGQWSWSRNEEEGGYKNIPDIGLIYFPKSADENRSYNVGVGTNWTLFDGLSNIATLNKNKTDLESARLIVERIKQDVVFQTITLYYNVINNMKLLKVKEEDITWNQKNLETVTERNRLGAVTLADVYAQQVRLGNAELEVIRTRNILESGKTDLLYYLGLDVLSNYTFSDSLLLSDQELMKNDFNYQSDDFNNVINKAMFQRFDYQSAKLNLESAKYDISIAQSGYFPTLTNGINFSTQANKPGDLFKSKYYSVGLTLNVPIFTGFNIDNRVQFAEVNYKNQELVVEELERDIKRKIQQTYLDIEASEKQLEVSKRNVMAAEENRKIEQEKYSLGSGTLLNVLIANSEYTTAQTNNINAQFSYSVLKEQLKYYLGVLDYKQYE